MKVAQEYIKNVDKLVPCPRVALDVMAIANDPDADTAKLAARIEQDPLLTANMLRFANSAYFGHMKKINSIADIIMRLGLESVKLIAIAGASAGLLKSGQEAYGLDTGQLARHSFASAVLAGILGRRAGAREIDALFTAALLHDVGKIVLNRHLQQALYAGGGLLTGRFTLLEMEHSLLHTDHARVGMLLLRQWGLADKIAVPVGLHHTLDHPKSKFLFCRVVYLANQLTEEVGIHAVDPAAQFFDVAACRERSEDFPIVPGFIEHMEEIMAEFHDRYQETVETFVL
ncbi:MAG: hypothetical protein COZ12_05550 [Deltaproteobacteria bacterium CG_4_10_14_3_um_filter_60_8]|nr:MAG: hypothetical protein AUK28_04525 [Desulfobacterales bacterium CG2_30_60_27]PIY21282.1 MAG: hypothetical protein COZ12_05550 [Deltaproteobacteria bacterium CG_4_10_14_3_um_filter_60_8]